MYTKIRINKLKVLQRVVAQQSFGGRPRRLFGRTAAAPRSRVPLVAQLDRPFGAAQGPVEHQTRKRANEGGQTAPALHAPVRSASAGIVRTAAVHVVRLGTMVEESLDAAQTRNVVNHGVGRQQTPSVARPALGQGLGGATRGALASPARGAHDGGARRAAGGRRRRFAKRHRLLVDGALGRHRRGRPMQGHRRRGRDGPPEGRLDVLIVAAIALGPGRRQRYGRGRWAQRSQRNAYRHRPAGAAQRG